MSRSRLIFSFFYWVNSIDSRKTWAIIHRIYDSVHMAFFAFGFVMIAYLIVFIIPRLSEDRASAER